MVNNKEIITRLKRIEESVNLSTFDTTTLGLMIFIFATIIALVSLGLPSLFKSNLPLFTAFILIVAIVIPLFGYIMLYAQTIFEIKKSFSTKVYVISYLNGCAAFLALNFMFLIISTIYENWVMTPKFLVYMVEIIFIILSAVYAILYVKPNVWSYFKKEFPEILNNRRRRLAMRRN